MVKERRYLFEVTDISSLIHECLSCGKELCYHLGTNDPPDQTCPGCIQPLLEERDAEYAFLSALRRLQSTQKKARDDLASGPRPKVRVRFVVPKSQRGG